MASLVSYKGNNFFFLAFDAATFEVTVAVTTYDRESPASLFTRAGFVSHIDTAVREAGKSLLPVDKETHMI